MKHLLVLLLGLLVGALLAVTALRFNPLVDEPRQPVTLDGPRTAEYFTSLSSAHTPLLTHDGQRRLPRRPDDVAQLWERPIRGATAAVVVLHDEAGEPVGVASRLAGWGRDTDPLLRGALMHSHWLISLPGQGMAFVVQRENFWPLLRDIALPAALRREPWSGERELLPAAGPRDSLSAQVIGAAGELRGRRGSLVSTYRLTGFDPQLGPDGLDARIIVSLPEADAADGDGPAAADDDGAGTR